MLLNRLNKYIPENLQFPVHTGITKMNKRHHNTKCCQLLKSLCWVNNRLLWVTILIMLALSLHPTPTFAQRDQVQLNGDWECKLDPKEQGIKSGWPAAGVRFDRTIQVPGAWQAQGAGEPGSMLRHDYTGAAWYRRKII